MGFVSGNHILLFVIFLVIVLVIFGPGKLPDVGAGMGRAIREFRKASSDVRDAVMSSDASSTTATGSGAPSSTPPPAPAAPLTPPAAPTSDTPRSTVHADRGA